MKKLLFSLIIYIPLICNAQYAYDSSKEFPYGQPHPKAPEEITHFSDLIGECDCKSVTRKKDQTWGEPVDMTWRFKYIMNGMAIQDETLKADGAHSGSIRQFIADSSRWYIHYYSSTSPTTVLSQWEGNKRGDSIVAYRKQKAPNGMDGYYRTTFKNISNKGYNWVGEWVNTQETFRYPTWKIYCTRNEE